MARYKVLHHEPTQDGGGLVVLENGMVVSLDAWGNLEDVRGFMNENGDFTEVPFNQVAEDYFMHNLASGDLGALQTWSEILNGEDEDLADNVAGIGLSLIAAGSDIAREAFRVELAEGSPTAIEALQSARLTDDEALREAVSGLAAEGLEANEPWAHEYREHLEAQAEAEFGTRDPDEILTIGQRAEALEVVANEDSDEEDRAWALEQLHGDDEAREAIENSEHSDWRQDALDTFRRMDDETRYDAERALVGNARLAKEEEHRAQQRVQEDESYGRAVMRQEPFRAATESLLADVGQAPEEPAGVDDIEWKQQQLSDAQLRGIGEAVGVEGVEGGGDYQRAALGQDWHRLMDDITTEAGEQVDSKGSDHGHGFSGIGQAAADALLGRE